MFFYDQSAPIFDTRLVFVKLLKSGKAYINMYILHIAY